MRTVCVVFLTIALIISFAGENNSMSQTTPGITLIDKGATDYVIVVSSAAIPAETYAARELQEHLTIMSGLTLEVVEERVPAGMKALCVGESPASLVIDRSIRSADMGNEAFRIRVVDGNVLIVGGRPRGTLYGVYGLLQDTLGCRWFTRSVRRVPRTDTIRVPMLDVYDEPDFEYREPFFTEAFEAVWAARNRVNSINANLDDSFGGKIHMSRFVHTFDGLVPASRYFDRHPEYFALRGGARLKDNTQLCLTNPRVIDIATSTALAWLEERPEDNIISVSQNDNQNFCECEACKKLDDAEGSHAGSLIAFVNAVAERIEQVRPDVAVDTLAYQYTQTPPRTIKPRPNVVVRLCHMMPSCDSHPLESCERNAAYVKDLEGWYRLTQRIYVWHYVTNFSHYQTPFPNFNAIARDIPYYHDHGVRGIFCQGAYQGGGGGEHAELRSYVLARQLWDKTVNVAELVNEYIEGVYGAAAPQIKAYFDLIHEQAKAPERHFHLYSPPEEIGITPALLLEAEGLFETAERNADSLALLRRVRYAKIPVLYGQVYYIQKKTPEQVSKRSSEDIIEEFKSLVTDYGITHVRESQLMADFLNSL